MIINKITEKGITKIQQVNQAKFTTIQKRKLSQSHYIQHKIERKKNPFPEKSNVRQ